MNKESAKAKFDLIIDGADRIIDNPSRSLKNEISIYKDSSGEWKYSKDINSQGINAGESVIVSASEIVDILVKVFLIPFPFQLIIGQNKRKKEQEEKERMYREIIKKQQAAINKQREINRQLEEKLHKTEKTNETNQKNIENLEWQIEHLEEVIDLLSQQAEQFDNVA